MKRILTMLLTAALALGLCACGGGATAEKPIKISSAMQFNSWFGEGKKLSKKNGEAVYFRLTGDIKLNKEGVIAGNNDITIDLNGHSITGGASRAFSVADSRLHLLNGTVETAGAPENGGVISVTGSGSVLGLVDVTLSNTEDAAPNATALGGVIYANGSGEPVQVHLRGNSVINGSSSGLRRSGGAVALAGDSVMYIHEGTVRGGQAGTAGNIYLEGNAILQLLGGSVEGGKARHNSEITGYGGNIYVQGLGSVYVAGGSITGGSAEKSGGNIYLANTAGEDAGLHFISGTMEGGTAAYDGGNLYAMDKFSVVRISGGSIAGGDAYNGGNIYLKSAELELRGGTLTGFAGSEKLAAGGNIYAENSALAFYDGTVTSGMALELGGNVCVFDSQVDIYGGSITSGAVVIADVTKGGGNFYAGRESGVRIYGGEISGGVSNCTQDQENSAAGGNVMVTGQTKLEMFGGTVKEGMVYGSITRGGSIYVCGQAKRSDVLFHMYGGLIENGPLDNKMRGMCIGSYSETKGNSGRGITRVFGGELRFTGAADNKNKIYTLHGNKTEGTDLYLFDPTPYEGMYNRTTAGPCPDPTHDTVTGQVEATCLTQGCTEHTCGTCGVWYTVTAAPTGHTETTQSTELGLEHSCTVCESHWYTEE